MRLALSLALCIVVSATGSAQVTPSAQFAGQVQEGFDAAPTGFQACIPQAFGGAGEVCTINSAGLLATPTWNYVCSLSAHSGTKFAASATTAVEVRFHSGAYRFGGWFGSNSSGGNARFDFYDVGGNLFSTQTAQFPADCAWRWFGWESCPTAIRRVVITGINTPSGAFVAMDGLQASFTPNQSCNTGPTTYCTSGTTSNGCNAQISATAQPSANFSAPMLINVANLEGQKTCLVFYGLDALAPQSWCVNTGTSFLCVKAPTQRTVAFSSGGTSGGCNGSISFDWNSFHLANPGAIGTPFFPGQNLYAQAWFRDPPSCRPTALSNAIKLTVQ
ncbi:MAG: hypothetical protein ACKO4Q_05295 [Planctomycetota bacterium]